ncbi:TspO/MBR family protein [Vermiculatibacterium agrestimuris]|uniref:TspO/MBR family protein n=1 Tax=Vermiculatibacterium agrestimuris TaxID=2941519 RepID=UPI0020417538|nr:TspO/MBR family protein [Vermiculatibacterium agrestimuris]
MRIQWKKWIVAVLIPEAVGGLSALLTKDGMERFLTLRQPPLSPPQWVFPVVWTLLFFLMGVASYLVSVGEDVRGDKRRALTLYALQLGANFLWTILFFNLGRYLLAFVWLLFLWVLILCTLRLFWRLSRPAGLLLLPYLLWVAFAGYLNFGIWLLN